MKDIGQIIEANIPGQGYSRISLADGRIAQVERIGPEEQSAPYCSPGFVDLQINGFAGIDFSSPDLDEAALARILPTLWSTGTTSIFATLITNTLEQLARNFRQLEQARKSVPGFAETVPGYHLEGPYMSPGPSRGVHNPDLMRLPDIAEFERLQDAAGGNIRVLTVAPERPGALELIRHASRHGVVVALGHTDGGAGDIHQAAAAGAALNTHLGNGSPQMMHRHQAPFWAQLADDRLAACIICDGFHLPPEIVSIIHRTKGLANCILVTDAVHVAMLPPGRYSLVGKEIELLASGQVVAADGKSLAGSVATLGQCVCTFMNMTGVALPDAMELATTRPARFFPGLSICHGFTPNEPANFILFAHRDGKIVVETTLLHGKPVYRRQPLEGWRKLEPGLKAGVMSIVHSSKSRISRTSS